MQDQEIQYILPYNLFIYYISRPNLENVLEYYTEATERKSMNREHDGAGGFHRSAFCCTPPPQFSSRQCQQALGACC
jgi:hypothetical protein